MLVALSARARQKFCTRVPPQTYGNGIVPMKRLHEMRSDGGNLLAGLFATVITTQMVPTIYTLGQLLSGIATVYAIFWAFQQSLISGFVWLVLLGPAMFLALIVSIRVVLEFVLTVFRIAFFLEALAVRSKALPVRPRISMRICRGSASGTSRARTNARERRNRERAGVCAVA
jgi:hypothetical protein